MGVAYLLDTHALVFWINQESISEEFIHFFDRQEQEGRLYVSPLSFWEIAFLAKRGKVQITDVQKWKDEILANTDIQLLTPTATEMIDSVNLPPIHKDPFDRLLISQAIRHNCRLVTKDQQIEKYDIETFWL